MGIFDAFKDHLRKPYVDKAESLGNFMQIEIYKHADSALSAQYGEEIAGKIAAGISNYTCQFGLISPAHKADKNLLSLCESERPAILRAFQYEFKVNSTGVLILLGAAWRVDLAAFKKHMSLLASEGFVKAGRETPDVSGDLYYADLVYMYEVTSIGATSAS